MFYENQSVTDKEQYKLMLKMMGQLSNLFSENESPYLAYRVHENIFCKCFHAINLARGDNSADAQKGNIGIGLKTWVGRNDQKVAEFGRLSPQYEHLQGIDLVRRISEYRNERIRVTKNLHGIDTMIYHIVKRVPHIMQILECTFEPIDISNISIIDRRNSDTNIYFTDNKHTYHFSKSKHTLYMIFDDLELLDTVNIDILADPFSLLMKLMVSQGEVTRYDEEKLDFQVRNKSNFGKLETITPLLNQIEPERLCLRLYTRYGANRGCEKYVQERSGLNQWNASGRRRDPDEIYIPYPIDDHRRNENFFPPRDTSFILHLPNGNSISAKVCQQGGKAIMSNPNKVLGHWLLRDVFELPEGTVVTYDMLERFGIDSVVFTKNNELDYSVDFSELGTYEKFYSIEE